MKFVGLLSVAIVLALSGCVHGYPPNDALMKGDQPRVPDEFKKGTASLEQVKAWSASLLSFLQAKPLLEVTASDLNQDGTEELLVSERNLAGSGGNSYLAFERTPTGYRYLGNLWFARIRVLTAVKSNQQKLLTMSCAGSGDCTVCLLILDAASFHEVARTELAAGNSGTEEGNRVAAELFEAKTVSPETLKRVFGTD